MKKHAALAILTLATWLFTCPGERSPTPGTLRFGILQDPVSLDPAATTDLIYVQIAFNIYETLIRVDRETGRLIPALATSWEVDREGTRWKFHLRPGVTFHDGSPLDARAVKVSFERQFDSSCKYFRAGSTDTHGRFAFDMIREIRIINDLTLEFRLRYPYSAFLHNVTSPLLAAIVSPSALEEYGDEFGAHPVGTGPWQLEQWSPARHIVLKRFDQYWGNLVSLQTIEYLIVPAEEDRVRGLQQGRLDVISGLSPSDAYKLYHDRDTQVVTQGLLATTFLGFHCQKPPFDDLRIRRAIAASLNIPTIVARISRGLAEPARTPLPPSIFAADSFLHQTAYDPQWAAGVLASDNSPALHRPIELHYFVETDTLLDHPKAQALKAALQKVGLRVRLVRYRDWERYRQNVLIAGKGHLFWDGWMSYIRHPDGFLYPLFHSQSPHNYLQYKNPRVDELLDEARRMPIGERQSELYREIQKIILHDAPAVFIAHPNAVYATRKYVNGFKVDALAIPWLDKVRIE